MDLKLNLLMGASLVNNTMRGFYCSSCYLSVSMRAVCVCVCEVSPEMAEKEEKGKKGDREESAQAARKEL